MSDGQINPGQVEWFPADKFDGWLWNKGDSIYISFIESRVPGKGHLSQLFDAIWKQGKTVKVPTPFAHMKAILMHKGFCETTEDTDHGPCEIWSRAP